MNNFAQLEMSVRQWAKLWNIATNTIYDRIRKYDRVRKKEIQLNENNKITPAEMSRVFGNPRPTKKVQWTLKNEHWTAQTKPLWSVQISLLEQPQPKKKFLGIFYKNIYNFLNYKLSMLLQTSSSSRFAARKMWISITFSTIWKMMRYSPLFVRFRCENPLNCTVSTCLGFCANKSIFATIWRACFLGILSK